MVAQFVCPVRRQDEVLLWTPGNEHCGSPAWVQRRPQSLGGGGGSQDGWNGGQAAATGCQAPPSRACLWSKPGVRPVMREKQSRSSEAVQLAGAGRDSHQPALTANGTPPVLTYSHSSSSVEHGVSRPDLPDHPRACACLHYRHLFPMPGARPLPSARLATGMLSCQRDVHLGDPAAPGNASAHCPAVPPWRAQSVPARSCGHRQPRPHSAWSQSRLPLAMGPWTGA